MIYIDDIYIEPNPVSTGREVSVKVMLHEEYEGAKRYEGRYPQRYGEKGEQNENTDI